MALDIIGGTFKVRPPKAIPGSEADKHHPLLI